MSVAAALADLRNAETKTALQLAPGAGPLAQIARLAADPTTRDAVMAVSAEALEQLSPKTVATIMEATREAMQRYVAEGHPPDDPVAFAEWVGARAT